MKEKISIIVIYFVVISIVGLLSKRYSRKTMEDFFIGGRRLGPVLLFFTMAATNFSAFTIFGFSGEGYRSGYAFYPIMAFGTAFMAISFSFLGKRVNEIGLNKGFISPAEFIGRHYNSRTLQIIVFIVMVIYTLPYIAIQPISAGYMLEPLLNIPYLWGGTIVMAVIVLYVLMGGFRGVVWTDFVQGMMMVILMSLAVFVLISPYGGIVKANESVFRSFPELFSRPGPENSFPISIWFSYMLLWFLCDPMFPQLFQRFLSARNRKSIDFTMLLYPIITGYLFLIPVMIGVIGRLSFPDLKGKEADRIIPMLLSIHADNWIGALILTAGLAALMSTLDSQLLTLSSMFTRDIFVYSKEGTKGSWLGRLFVIIIAIIGLLIAYRPPATILVIATQTFTGLAVLFPAFVGGLYWSGATSKGAIISIITGELLVVAYILKLLPTFGFLPVIPVCFMTSMVFVISSILDSYIRNGKLTLPTINGHWIKGKKDFLISLLIMGIIFLLGIDFWAWGSAIPLILGFPWWIWYFFGLNILLIIAMALFLTDSSPFFPSSHKPDGTCQGHN